MDRSVLCGGKVGALLDSDLSTFFLHGHHDVIAEERREGRKHEADAFRRRYSYGSSLEQNNTILISSDDAFLLMDKSSGIIWVGVHGMNSICVVTRTGDLDVTRVHRDLKYLTKETVLRRFRRTIISEIEDLASPSSKLGEIGGLRTLKPFGVVSVIRVADNFHKESGLEASSDEYEEDEVESSQVSSDEHESNDKKMARLRKSLLKQEKRQKNKGPKIAGYDEKKTIKFLREQMRVDTACTINETIQESSTQYHENEAIDFLQYKMLTMKMEAFTVDETIKTAISAFQHLFQKNFKADEIEVTVMDPNYFVSIEEADYKDIYVKELEMSDIEYHLAAINEPGGSFGSWSPELNIPIRIGLDDGDWI